MGNFNSQYEDYYRSLNGRRTRAVQFSKTSSTKQKTSKGNLIYRRIVRDLVGVFILFSIVLGCKMVSTARTGLVYNYSKEIVSQNYDTAQLKNTLFKIDAKGIQEKITNLLEGLRARITGEKTYQEKIKSEFIKPVDGIIMSTYGERKDPITSKLQSHRGIDIDAKLNTEIKACYEGKVKECGEDKDLGKYILINHGNGIETKYAHLNDFTVKKEDAVKKGEVIAKSGNTGKSTGPHLHFELLYMGEEENPENFFSFKKQ